jgi:RHS repeat-associated protein
MKPSLAFRCIEIENATAITQAYPAIVTAEYQYDAWGLSIENQMMASSFTAQFGKFAATNRYKYNDKEYISDSKLYDYGARHYDPVVGRWGAVDPLADEPEQVDKSSYAYAWNNPVYYTDPDGRCPLCSLVIGAGVDYAFQVTANMADGKSFTESLTYDIDLKSIAISGATGFATSGLSAIGGKGTQFVITTAIDATESVAKQATSGNGSVTLTETISDVASNKVAGFLTKKAENIVDTKVLRKDADRTARVSANDPSSSGRATRAETAQTNLNKANKVNKIVGQTASGVVGNTIQNTSNVVGTPSGSSIYTPAVGVAKSDATNVQKPVVLILRNL